MLKKIFTSLALLCVCGAVAQQTTNEEKLKAQLKEEIKAELKQELLEEAKAEVEVKGDKVVSFKPYGFVRNYITYNSRDCYAVMGEIFNVMPYDQKLNQSGDEDLNKINEFAFVAFTTRFGVDVSTGRIGGAAASAKIEADFSGYGDNNTLFRVRHAYLKLAWDRVVLYCGQTWHPMVNKMMTSTVNYNAGSPFVPFNRTPQIKAEFDMGKGWAASAALMYQLPNTSIGPSGGTYDYARWSMIPEVGITLEHRGRSFSWGAVADILSIKPRKHSTALRQNPATGEMESVTVNAKDRVTGFSSQLFAEYKENKFNIKGATLYCENTTHLIMVSGFGATSYDSQSGKWEYAPLRSLSSWINITYGKRCEVGLFGGYMDNLGAKRDFISTEDMWTRGANNVDYIYRLGPTISYNIKNLTLALELDYTAVGYGDVAIDGNTKALREVGNWRACTMIRYSF